ncbi:NAD(P)-dependent glycerol-3-phosphate dehydrogenase [Candidatus Persebacteraceae bacterium Df01]|uniref:Glycerol-3-phosphate dehydrogenase [NAD(P)+] n=1 Tax=Candidatus Doriopsillibacter californiensis TaxID=2970740 RepID=A0ABT7QK38_9GAMM|nr:NAD(P)-dependent glycerol-3-phosphate dehydrogenase [Candidatus Persebacteraceae bacterium Df01]
MSCRIAILGAGAWGSALGYAIRQDNVICFWARSDAAANKAAERFEAQYTSDIADALKNADLIIIAVSTAGFGNILTQINCHAPSSCPVMWLTKGFLPNGDRLLHDAAAEQLNAGACFGAISGPSFAADVAKGRPAALALAVNKTNMLEPVQKMLHRKKLRLYPTADLAGVCAGGALKNVIAIAAGVCDGMSLGASARAALITRGLHEMVMLGTALGGNSDTLHGIAGVGDLLLTCTSDLSRNRRFGLALGAEKELPANTCEGVNAAAAARRCARRCGVESPIINAVDDLLQGVLSPSEAMNKLLARPPQFPV